MVARVGGPVAPYVEFCWLNDSYQLTIHPMIPAAEAFVPSEEEMQVIEEDDENYEKTLETEEEEEEEEWEEEEFEEEGEESDEEDTDQKIVVLN